MGVDAGKWGCGRVGLVLMGLGIQAAINTLDIYTVNSELKENRHLKYGRLKFWKIAVWWELTRSTGLCIRHPGVLLNLSAPSPLLSAATGHPR